MAKVELAKESLAALLCEAEKAHGLYESQLGHRDDDWPTWYAAYIMDKLVPGVGVEPTLPKDRERDFKSLASADSATRARKKQRQRLPLVARL